jgi:hypothetical protein
LKQQLLSNNSSLKLPIETAFIAASHFSKMSTETPEPIVIDETPEPKMDTETSEPKISTEAPEPMMSIEAAEPPCTPASCGPIKDVDDDVDDDLSFFERIRTGKFKIPDIDFDKLCHSGVVIDDAAVQGKTYLAETVEELPEKSKEFAEEHAPILKSKSDMVQEKVKDGLAAGFETLKTLPATFSEKWAEAKEIYHENQKVEAENAAAAAAVEEGPPLSNVAVVAPAEVAVAS